jgi:ribosomal protein S12 methylthiotransferase accessory factor YcaO
VVLVVRPEGRALAQAQGKGLDRPAAEASGLMEAIEAWHAERPRLPVIVAACRELVGR